MGTESRRVLFPARPEIAVAVKLGSGQTGGMKKMFFGMLVLTVLLAGCSDKKAEAEKRLLALTHEQFKEQVANIKIRVRNGAGAADISELINQLETFHEVNKGVFQADEADYSILDASLHSLAYLKQRKLLEPTRNQNDMALMLILRPELKDRILKKMNSSDWEQDAAFWSAIYWPAATDLVVRHCDEILQK